MWGLGRRPGRLATAEGEPAEGPDSVEVVWISVGGHQLVKTAKGTVSVGCP